MKRLTVEQHRKRVQNMRCAEEKVQKYFKKMRFHDYIPGHVVYNMGCYPRKVEMAPTEYDYTALKRLKDCGFQWVQLHDDVLDRQRLYGGNTFMNGDWEGARQFIVLCHHFGHKILPYISPSYFPPRDPEFREEFLGLKLAFENSITSLSSCSMGSPEWREFNFRNTFDVLDRLEFDGVYGDFGYEVFLGACNKEWESVGNSDKALYATYPYDPEAEDFFGMIYAELKSRGLYYKLHLGGFQPIPVKDKVYDYLWVGEAGKNVKDIISCKNHEPYLAPAFDRNSAPLPDPELAYTLTIPFAQFPILYYGRPRGTECRNNVPGATYYREFPVDEDYEFYCAHPNGPYRYSEWSSFPDDPDEFDRATQYLALYKPMVEEGSVVRMEIRETSLITSAIPEDVYISMFTNEEQYLVVGNTTEGDYTLTLTDDWTDRQTGKTAKEFTVAKNRLLFLVKA